MDSVYAEVYDTNNDGQADTALVDVDGDHQTDLQYMDTDGDGQVDLVLADRDGDGEVDAFVADTNADGLIDVAGEVRADGSIAVVADTDYDGQADSGALLFAVAPNATDEADAPLFDATATTHDYRVD